MANESEKLVSDLIDQRTRQRILENSEELRVCKKKYMAELNKKALALQISQKQAEKEKEKFIDKTITDEQTKQLLAEEEENLKKLAAERENKKKQLADALRHQIQAKRQQLRHETALNDTLKKEEEIKQQEIAKNQIMETKRKVKRATRLLAEQLSALEARQVQRREDRQKQIEIDKQLSEEFEKQFPARPSSSREPPQWKGTHLEYVLKQLARQNEAREKLLNEREDLLTRLYELEREESERKKHEEIKKRKVELQEMLRESYEEAIQQKNITKLVEENEEKELLQNEITQEQRLQELDQSKKESRRADELTVQMANVALVEQKNKQKAEEVKGERLFHLLCEEEEKLRTTILNEEFEKILKLDTNN